MSGLQICLVQERFQVGDVWANAEKMLQACRQVERQAVDLVVFPELALTGYPPEDLLHRDDFMQCCEQACEWLAERLPAGLRVIFGLPLRAPVETAGAGHYHRQQALYNALVCVWQGRVVFTYHKQSLPNYAVFDEKRYFVAGDAVGVLDIEGVRLGLLVCEDVWQPAIVAATVAAGAECLLVCNASPYHIGKHDDRLRNLQGCAGANRVPLLYLNMVGGQDELVFDGESMVFDARGRLQQRGRAFEADRLRVCYADGALVVSPQPVGERADETQLMYRALVTGVRDFVRHNGFGGVVIGLSGGVDSALTLVIAVDALGAENVHAVMMPSRYTADISLQDAQAQAQTLGVRYDVIEIEPVFKTFLSSLSPVFDGAPEDVTEENLQARCRGVMLMAISNKSGRMVLTTGNKSEMAVGYATLYGDMCGGFAPLKDVSKTRVYELCRYRNRQDTAGAVIPERVLSRAPSAELREDQCDQDSLPDYAVLDAILTLSVEQDASVDDIVARGFERETVQQVVAMVQRNEYKRRQAAPGIRLSRRAFGRDRRYPVTSGFGRRPPG